MSGSSVGSLYHHFGNKEGIAAALYEEGISEYQRGILEVLAGGGSVDTVIGNLVRRHLAWVMVNPAWARFLLEMGRAPATASAHPAVQQGNEALLEKLDDWARPHTAAGDIVDVPPMTLLALVLGPCHAMARAWLAGDAALTESTIDVIAAAVVRAVQTR